MAEATSWKPWAIGLLIAAGVGGWVWWQAEHPDLVNGDYWCEGHTVGVDGSRSLINASAEVVDGKIRVGQTGLDVVAGHSVTSWGDVEITSRSQFLAEIRPSSEIASIIAEPFWVTCQLE